MNFIVVFGARALQCWQLELTQPKFSFEIQTIVVVPGDLIAMKSNKNLKYNSLHAFLDSSVISNQKAPRDIQCVFINQLF